MKKFARQQLLTITLFITSLVIISLIGITSYGNTRELKSENDEIAKYRDMVYYYETIRTALTEAESAERAYLLSPELVFLKNFREAGRDIRLALYKLERLTVQRQAWSDSLDTISREITHQIGDWESRLAHGSSATLLQADQESKKIKAHTIRAITTIRKAVDKRAERRTQKTNQVMAMQVVGTFLSLAFFSLAFGMLWRQMQQRKIAENQYRDNAQLLQTFFEHIPSMVFIKEAQELRFIAFNKAGEDLTGFSRNDMIGKNDHDFFPPEQATFFTGQDRMVIEQGIFLDIPEEPIDTKHKGRRILHTKKVPIIDADGNPKYLLGISEDITEYKMLEEARNKALAELEAYSNMLEKKVQERTEELYASLGELNASNEEIRTSNEVLAATNERLNDTISELDATRARLQLALDAAQMGIGTSDLSFNTMMFNPQLEALHGLKVGEFEGKYRGSAEAYMQMVHPDDRVAYQNAVAKSIREKKDFQMEYRVIWPDGSTHWLYGAGKAIYDEAGKPLHIIGIGMDITLRKEAEDRIRKSQELLLSMFEVSPDAIFLYDEKNNLIEYCNDAAVQLFGFDSKDQLLGQSSDLFLRTNQTDAPIATIKDYLKENQFWNNDVEYVSHKGRKFWGSVAASYIASPEKPYYMVRIRDITDRILYQQELAEQKLKIEKAFSIIEQDNRRKTKELEDARDMQLAMLPQEAPRHPLLEIDMYMKTSTEVGGDYYDYKPGNGGSLIFVIGDATGHGLKAGIVVATVKSYFRTLAHQRDVVGMLKNISDGINNLQIRAMYMGLTAIHICDTTFTIASSGMPPLLLYKQSDRKAQIIMLKGPFLGSDLPMQYEHIGISLQPGDVLLAMSDGLPELFNEQREVLDYIRIKDCFEKVAHLSPKQIIKALIDLGDRWTEGRSNEDDVTLVVFKVK